MEKPAESHLHRCQSCGTIWGHGNMMQGDVEAHKCPSCGKTDQWRVYSGGKSHAVPVQRGRERTSPWAAYLLVAAFVLLLTWAADWLASKSEKL